MRTFLEETIYDLKLRYSELSNLVVVLPSKRAGGFFKQYLKATLDQATFLPLILSIEEFIEEIADLRIISNTELLLKSYDAYLEAYKGLEPDTLDQYLNWAQVLLNDLNEIDRHLVEQESFFGYLESIKALEQWSAGENPSKLMVDYLEFWKRLPEFYEILTDNLKNEGVGFQGMVYRSASEELEHYLSAKGTQPHVFIGFNALNKAEQFLIKGMLEQGNTQIYWDADRAFFDAGNHSASLFMKSYFDSWKYYEKEKPSLAANFEKEKNIEIIQTQGKISQAKYIGTLLQALSEEELSKTAVVLADESLLTPLLHSIPENVKSLNITMGVGIKSLPITQIFIDLLRVHTTSSFYYKDVFKILNQPVVRGLVVNADSIIAHIRNNNHTYLKYAELNELNEGKDSRVIQLLFDNWKNDSSLAVSRCLSLIDEIRGQVSLGENEITVLFEISKIFRDIETNLSGLESKPDIKTLKVLFASAIQEASVDFQGDAYSGLQLMGVLETRVLDFENIIVASVNEGIFPSGRTNASYITNDMKQQYGLPGYLDKDSIYAFHFYHMLQRASNVWLLYENNTDGINLSEKSRFILQLEKEGLSQHKLIHKTLSSSVSFPKQELLSVQKTAEVLNRLKTIAAEGFSPSSLTMYIRNPIDFYVRRILRIGETETVEETIDYSTLGTVVHNSLETLYKPFEGKVLEANDLNELKSAVHEEVSKQFEHALKKGNFSTGKNLLIFEVSKRYVNNMIDFDVADIEAGNRVEILKIEESLKVPVTVTELSLPVFLKGKVDRVDRYNGDLRIIDYKTGAVKPEELQIGSWESLTDDYKFSKTFQVLAYAYMMNAKEPFLRARAGIISSKNMQEGFMEFGLKAGVRGNPPTYGVNEEVLSEFQSCLFTLIKTIFDPETAFVEKEVKDGNDFY